MRFSSHPRKSQPKIQPLHKPRSRMGNVSHHVLLTPRVRERNSVPRVSGTPHTPTTTPRRVRDVLRTVMMHLIGWPIVVLLLVTIVVEAGMLLLLFGEHDYSGRIYPNISIQGLNLSNHTFETATMALNKRYEAFLEHPIELRYGDYSWYPTAADLGITLELDRALHEAATIGHTNTRMENTRTVAAVWEQGLEIPLHMTINQHTMQRYLLTVAQVLDTPSRNADVALQGQHIIVTDEHTGLQVLIDDTVRDVTAALQNMSPHEPVDIRTRPIIPIVRHHDVQPVITELGVLLTEPIELIAPSRHCTSPNGDECRWELSPSKIATWVHLVRDYTPDGIPTVAVHVDQTAIHNALLPIAEMVRREGTLPRVSWNEGNLQIAQAGLSGRGLDVALAQSHINDALTGGTRTIELPMQDIAPPVNETNLATLGITAPVATGVSSFLYSQPYRITNIQAGARRMNGLLIPPGDTFSFNDNLGAVDASNGFVQGSAIVNNRTQQEWGGGLCQVSTTMFRAAFWAGLPIVERHEHNFRITWYEELGEPPGFDAAIFTGAHDVRFVNDTGNWLLIQTWVDTSRQRLFISLYGTPTGRHVEMSHRILKNTPAPTQPTIVDDPTQPVGVYKQTDWAQPGMEIDLFRVVYEGGVVTQRDTFHTIFKPWPNIFVRGTKH